MIWLFSLVPVPIPSYLKTDDREKSDINVPLERSTVIEYHEGASESESDKKIKLTFPPDTSPEKMEEIIERAARAFLGNVSRENTPKQPVKEKSKNSAG